MPLHRWSVGVIKAPVCMGVKNASALVFSRVNKFPYIGSQQKHKMPLRQWSVGVIDAPMFMGVENAPCNGGQWK